MYIVKNAIRSIARAKGRNILICIIVLVIAIFRQLSDEGKCIILVTHSPQVSNACDEIYSLAVPTAK